MIKDRPNHHIIIILTAAYLSTVALNVVFINRLPRDRKTDIIQNMFGGLRALVADWAFMRAEEYHHRGLPFLEAMEFHQGESLIAGSAARGTESPEHEEHARTQQVKKNLYESLYDQIRVTGDSHLTPAEEKEVLPWFYVETDFDPHDTRGYILGGYWLKRIGRDTEGLQFLEKGLANNPDSARIMTAIGELYYKKADYANAKRYLESACGLWMGKEGENAALDGYSATDRYFAFDMLADIYKKEGRVKDASKVYHALYALTPSTYIKNRMDALDAQM